MDPLDTAAITGAGAGLVYTLFTHPPVGHNIIYLYFGGAGAFAGGLSGWYGASFGLSPVVLGIIGGAIGASFAKKLAVASDVSWQEVDIF